MRQWPTHRIAFGGEYDFSSELRHTTTAYAIHRLRLARTARCEAGA